MSRTRHIAGAMSGTSADGVDVAIVRIEGEGASASTCMVVHTHRPYEPALRQRIFEVRSGRPVDLRELADLARQISLVYAAAVNEAIVKAHIAREEIAAIAAHGQTLFHEPPLTIQWLDPALLAAETGCAVISDFRRADCAAGGQGAPLVPFADHALFTHHQASRVLVNIGGIANITWLCAGGGLEKVMAFDTGPGNCVCDWLMRRFDPGGPGYDAGGRRALAGSVNEPAVQRMLGGRYFCSVPPKSTDGPAMIEAFREAMEGALGDFRLDDLLATAAAFTADAIADAIDRFLPAEPAQLVVSGGGIANAAIMGRLQQRLPDVPVLRSDELGICGLAKEAVAFALLAAATLDSLPSNVPSATGASRAVVLGCITPRP